MNRRYLYTLSLTALLASAGAAQVDGRIDYLRGCTNPGPADSLRAELVSPPVWVADANGYVGFEIESHPRPGGWRYETNFAGYSGTGYYRWDDQNQPTQGGFGLMTFQVKLPFTETYQLRIHNFHNNPEPNQSNDCWVRVDGGEWTKVYSNLGQATVGVWNWHSNVLPRQIGAAWLLSAGTHTVEISARSNGFCVDRVHMFPRTVAGEDINLPISERLRSTPIVGGPLALEMDDPNDEAGLPTNGSTTAFLVGTIDRAPGGNDCGTAVPGFGPTGGPGDALLNLPAGTFLLGGPLAWSGPGHPAVARMVAPNDPGLLGYTLLVQGIMVDGGSGRGVFLDGARLTFGNR